MYNLHLLEYSAETFRYNMQHYLCLAVTVELAVMVFVFRFIEIGIVEMSLWVTDQRVYDFSNGW